MIETASTDAPTGGLAGLGSGARLFIWGFRALAQMRRGEATRDADIQTLFEHFGVEAALAPLDTVLRVSALTAHGPLGLHCAGCARLSDGEAALICAAAAAQDGDIERVREELARLILPSAADWVWVALYEIGRIFEAADLPLEAPPRRRVALRVIPGGRARVH